MSLFSVANDDIYHLNIANDCWAHKTPQSCSTGYEKWHLSTKSLCQKEKNPWWAKVTNMRSSSKQDKVAIDNPIDCYFIYPYNPENVA